MGINLAERMMHAAVPHRDKINKNGGGKKQKKSAAPIEGRMRCLKRVGKWGEKKRDLKAYFLLSEGTKTKGILSAGYGGLRLYL